MSSKTGLSDPQKKALTIIVPVVIVVIALIVGTVFFLTNKTEKGQEVLGNAERQFSAVEIPKDSSELTYVREAPVGRQDKSSDDFNGVDMLGNKIKRSTPTEKPSSTKKERPKGTNTQKPRPRPQQHRQPSAEEMKQVSNVGKRVKIPSLNANFTLGKLHEPESGIIEPTNFTSVFWVENRGVKYDNTSKGTTYLAMHALDLNPDGKSLSGIAPGNWLYDPFTRDSKLQPGDIMEVGGVKFKFKEYKRAGKGLIARDKDIWNEKTPNRLVAITCIASSNDNGVFIFEKA